MDHAIPAQDATHVSARMPTIRVCVCDGCAAAGWAPARTWLGQLPAGAERIHLPCARAFEPPEVLTLLLAQPSGLLLVGCRDGGPPDYEVDDRLRVMRFLLRQMGLAPERVSAEWLATTDAERVARGVERLQLALGLAPNRRP
jgi:coenzyme F420-reducing hydrogenase delta subunit